MSVDAAADLILGFGRKRNGDPITQLDVQKLLYFAQGFHLALCGEPLFDEDMYAWRHGPVLKSLRGRFRFFKDKPIPSSAVRTRPEYVLAPGAQDLIARVWRTFSIEDSGSLVGLTHLRGTPWDTVRTGAGIARDEDSDLLIPKALMLRYFRTILPNFLAPDPERTGMVSDDEWLALAG